MPGPPLLLIHGAAVTAAVWDPVVPYLDDYELRIPERPRTGDLALEVDSLLQQARGAFVVGMSGGATLGLALAAQVSLAGALLHEPAVGRLAPTLLAPIAAAYAAGGVAGFGATLYGPSWSIDMAVDTDESLGRELAMFRGFEPAAPAVGQGAITISVGELSPPVRYESVNALADRFGYGQIVIPGARHFVAVDSPAEFATAILASVAAV